MRIDGAILGSQEEMHGANADLIRLHDAGDIPGQPRHLSDPIPRSQSVPCFLNFSGWDWRAAEAN